MSAPLEVRVYKLGGPALEDPSLLPALAREITSLPGRVLVVHGGGRQVDRALEKASLVSRFVDGRRATSPEAMDVVEMVLAGSVNKAVAAGLTAAGLRAVGVSGRDAALIRARPREGLGRVGAPVGVDTRLLDALWGAGLLPVVAPVSAGTGGEALNVNADEAALALACAVSAAALVYFSDVDGVKVGDSPVARLTAAEAQRRIADGTIAGGMALKVRVALEAAEAGIPEVLVAGRARLVGGFPGTRIVGGARVEAIT